jgi:hypothetical protein
MKHLIYVEVLGHNICVCNNARKPSTKAILMCNPRLFHKKGHGQPKTKVLARSHFHICLLYLRSIKYIMENTQHGDKIILKTFGT